MEDLGDFVFYGICFVFEVEKIYKAVGLQLYYYDSITNWLITIK